MTDHDRAVEEQYLYAHKQWWRPSGSAVRDIRGDEEIQIAPMFTYRQTMACADDEEVR